MVTTTRDQKKGKRERVRIGDSRLKLQGIQLIPELRAKYHVRWVNDTADRLQRFLDRGYDFVTSDETVGRVGDKEVHGDNSDLNSRVSKVTGENQRSYFMKLPMEFYEEDQADILAETNRIDEAIRGGTPGGASIANAYGKVTMR